MKNYFDEGNKYYSNKDYQKAIDCYRQSAFSKNNEACSYYNIGVCLIKLRKYDDAIVMLNKAASFKKESKYFFNLGYCYAMKECLGTALCHFNFAWSMDPSDKDCERAVNLMISKIILIQ